MIDGNYTHQPAAYCTYHKGFLTGNMAKRHYCKRKTCPHYHSNTDSYISELDKEYILKEDVV